MILRPCIDHPYETFCELETNASLSLITEIMLMADHLNPETKCIEISLDDFLALDVPGFKTRLLWELSNRRHRAYLKENKPETYNQLDDFTHYQFSFKKKEEAAVLARELDIFSAIRTSLKSSSVGRWLTTFPEADLIALGKRFRENKWCCSIPRSYVRFGMKELKDRIKIISENFRVVTEFDRWGNPDYDPALDKLATEFEDFVLGKSALTTKVFPARKIDSNGPILDANWWASEGITEDMVDRAIHLVGVITKETETTQRDAMFALGINPSIAKHAEQYEHIKELQNQVNLKRPIIGSPPLFTLKKNVGTKGFVKALDKHLPKKFVAEAFFIESYKEELGIEPLEVFPYYTSEYLAKIYADYYKEHGVLLLSFKDIPYRKQDKHPAVVEAKKFDRVVINTLMTEKALYMGGALSFDGFEVKCNLNSYDDDNAVSSVPL